MLVEGHAYGGRPAVQPARSSYSAKQTRPGTFSYVRPAAKVATPARPAATISKYSASSKLSSSSSIGDSSTYDESNSRGGQSIFGTLATASGYDGQSVYYTTESVYYTTTPHSYYAEHIYYSTEQPYTNYGVGQDSGAADSPYTYVDPSTYFGEDVVNQYASPADTAAPYAAPATPVDYSGYVTETVPAYVDQPAYNAVGSPAEEFTTPATYYGENSPVNNGQPSYSVGNDVVYSPSPAVYNVDYSPSAAVYNVDYTTTVPPPVYYSAEQAATISPFIPTDIQYGP